MSSQKSGVSSIFPMETDPSFRHGFPMVFLGQPSAPQELSERAKVWSHAPPGANLETLMDSAIHVASLATFLLLGDLHGSILRISSGWCWLEHGWNFMNSLYYFMTILMGIRMNLLVYIDVYSV